MTAPSPLLSALLVAVVVALIAAAAAYCARFRLPRPPVGTHTYWGILTEAAVCSPSSAPS